MAKSAEHKLQSQEDLDSDLVLSLTVWPFSIFSPFKMGVIKSTLRVVGGIK